MSLTNLPPELLNLIIDRLTDSLEARVSPLVPLRAIYALSHTCRAFWENFIWRLYRYDAQRLRSSALIWSAAKGIMTTAEQSLAQGASLLATNQHGQSPLWLAARNGHEAMVQYLVQQNGDVQFRSPIGITPLAVAAREGYLSIVQLLIRFGADPNTESNDHASPLLWATRTGEVETVKALLQLGAKDPNDDPGKFWRWSLAAYRSGAWKHLPEIWGMQLLGLELSDERLLSEDALVHAVRLRYVAMTKYFLKELMLDLEIGAQVQKQETRTPTMLSLGSLSTALYYAIWHGDEDIVELLLGRGADTNTLYNPWNFFSLPLTPLILALNRGFHGIAEQFLDHGADPNWLLSTPDLSMLAWATQNKLETVVFKMLENGANPNPFVGVQPLLVAIWAQSPVIVKTLLEFGADPNTPDRFWCSDGKRSRWFRSALPYARWVGNQDIVDSLEQYGAVHS